MKTLEEVKNLYDYIELTKDRPAMYFGEATLSALYFHVCGYQTACYTKCIDEELAPDFNLFNDFVADYYLRCDSTAGWRKIILADCFGNETSALQLFYEIFALFRQHKKPINAKKTLFKILKSVTLNQASLDTLRQEESKTVLAKLNELPTQLECIKFSFEYDDLLEEFIGLAHESIYLQKLLAEIDNK